MGAQTRAPFFLMLKMASGIRLEVRKISIDVTALFP